MKPPNNEASNSQGVLDSIIRPHLKEQAPYEAKSFNPDEISLNTKLRNLDGNENPFGPSPLVGKAIAASEDLHLYPDHLQKEMRGALSSYTGVQPDNIIVGNGCDELIDLLIKVAIDPNDIVLEAAPTFGMYSFTTKSHGGQVRSIDRTEVFDLDLPTILESAQNAKLIFLASPNNPTGNLLPWEHLKTILGLPMLVVVDDTYYEFSKITFTERLNEYPNLVVLRSFSKWAGLAGLRVGYGMMHSSLVEQLLRTKPPYSVSKPAELAMLASLKDKDYLLSNVDKILTERMRMEALIAALPSWTVWPSYGNFLLCEHHEYSGRFLTEHLAKSGIFVRPFSHPRLQNAIRISSALPEDTDALVKLLSLLN